MNAASRNRITLVLICLLIVWAQVAGGLCAARNVTPPPASDLFYSLGLLWLGGMWLHADARDRRFRWPYCLGILLWVAWMIVVPYYLWRTRGVKGMLMLLGLLAAYLLTNLIGVAVYLLLA